MNYKVEGAIRKNKKYFIIFGILWLFIAIVLIVPLVLSYNMPASEGGSLGSLGIFVDTLKNPFKGFVDIISKGYMGAYIKTLITFSIMYIIFFIVGVARSAPKNEYTDFEHGSSDWSRNGEQYQILNNKKGIVLAENNYLPVDKRGNVNILVVGGSGSGKSASYSIPNAFQLLGSYVFTDPKGELYDRTAGYLRAN